MRIAIVTGDYFNSSRVHLMRCALARPDKARKVIVATSIRTPFAQKTAEDPHSQWRKVAGLLNAAEHDALADMQFPKVLRSTTRPAAIKQIAACFAEEVFRQICELVHERRTTVQAPQDEALNGLLKKHGKPDFVQ